MEKNKRDIRKFWSVEDVFVKNSSFWEFSDKEIEDYCWESFLLKHKIKVFMFDCFLICCFIFYVIRGYL